MNFGKHGFWGFFSLFALIYLTDSIGMSPSLAGALLFASLLFDAAVDVPAGAILDQVRSRLKTYGPVVAASALACAATSGGFFAIAALGGGPGSLAIVLVLLLAFRIAFTIYDLSDNALASRITHDPHRRTQLSAARKVAAALATLGLGLATDWLLSADADNDMRFLLAAATLSSIMAVLIPLAYAPLRRADEAAPPLRVESYQARWRALRRSSDAWMLTAVTLIEAAATPILISGLAYFSRFAYGSAAWAGAAIAAVTLAQVVSQPLWISFARWFGKKRALQFAHAWLALCVAAFAAAPPMHAHVLLVILFAAGVATGGVSTIRWSLAPDIIDRAEQLSGVRVESGTLSLMTTAIQVGAGISAGALGLALSQIGYAPDAPFPPASSFALLVAAPVAAANAVCALLLFYWRFPESRDCTRSLSAGRHSA